MIIFWFRRDLRIEDNVGLHEALRTARKENLRLQPIFIFDSEILGRLTSPLDARVAFIHQAVQNLKQAFQSCGSDLQVFHGKPIETFTRLIAEKKVKNVFCNHDYEPSAIARDQKIAKLLGGSNIEFLTFKDQVIFEKDEILTATGNPYTIFTPYKRCWLKTYLSQKSELLPQPAKIDSALLVYHKNPQPIPSLKSLGFQDPPASLASEIPEPKDGHEILKSLKVQDYQKTRDFPAQDSGSRLGIHLRFGTVSIRSLVKIAFEQNQTFLSELIWREFFMQILFHFPQVENSPFKKAYAKVKWRNSSKELSAWKLGETGYPLVDAGMRELNTTGYMHNRVRMVTASFLCKHLLIDWRKGEKYFAERLLDFELASNNGNWQWAASTGCDAVPYFRIFNPELQQKRFDPQFEYIRKWVPEFDTPQYPNQS